MDSKMRERYELLKKKNKEHARQCKWKNNSFYTEFLKLVSDVEMIPENQWKELMDKLLSKQFYLKAGHIKNMDMKNEIIISYHELEKMVDITEKYIIVWINNELPPVKCSLCSVVENIDDVEAVDFSFILISEDSEKVFESYKSGMARIVKL